MKTSHCLAAVSLAGTVFASPVVKRQNIDNTVLQFALTLEHLENAFYEGAVVNFSAQDFADAGYDATYYNNLKYIAHDEQVHVQALTAALQANGQTPVAACTYSFPYTDVPSFITLSSILEGVGTSAYLGGAPLISSKYYLTVAGSILATEALHTSYQRAAIGEVPMANPFETPLNPNPVYTLAAAFIVTCPTTNPPLPFTPFPTLTAGNGAANGTANTTCVGEGPSMRKRSADPWSGPRHGGRPGNWWPGGWGGNQPGGWGGNQPGNGNGNGNQPGNGNGLPPKTACAAAAGSPYAFTAASAIPEGSYVTFASGLSVASVQGTINGNTTVVTIPAIASGQTYVFITTNSENATVPDADILFGPAILEVAPAPPTIDYSIQ